jgi:hypothetical protein
MEPQTYKLTGGKPSLKTLQKFVGGLIQIVFDDGKTQIICNEEGKLLGLPINTSATQQWYKKLCSADKEFIKANPDYLWDDFLCGNVVILEDENRID